MCTRSATSTLPDATAAAPWSAVFYAHFHARTLPLPAGPGTEHLRSGGGQKAELDGETGTLIKPAPSLFAVKYSDGGTVHAKGALGPVVGSDVYLAELTDAQ